MSPRPMHLVMHSSHCVRVSVHGGGEIRLVTGVQCPLSTCWCWCPARGSHHTCPSPGHLTAPPPAAPEFHNNAMHSMVIMIQSTFMRRCYSSVLTPGQGDFCKIFHILLCDDFPKKKYDVMSGTYMEQAALLLPSRRDSIMPYVNN